MAAAARSGSHDQRDKRRQCDKKPKSSLKRLARTYLNREYLINLLVNPEFTWLAASVLFVAEILVNVWIIENVPYTEIDWRAYMQEVEGVVNGTYDYSQLKGETGPLVYPAGFVYVFLSLYQITHKGQNIYFAQYIYAAFYLITLVLVFRIYIKTKKVPPFVLCFLCCTSYRVHSIFVLRLFNDPVAMLIFYLAVNLYMSNRWLLGSIAYSFAVAIKMNILLFAPALMMLMLASQGIRKSLLLIAICAGTQILLALPFLIANPVAYITRAFDLKRVFLYQWTVNWKFLPEIMFVNGYFHVFLLFLHLVFLALFFWVHWRKIVPTYKQFLKGGVTLSPNSLFLPLCTSNFIGIAFSRSLHYQFYVWYFHMLPYLLWNVDISYPLRICILGVIEFCWNVYPSTWYSSLLLHASHLILLVALFRLPPPQSIVLALRKDEKTSKEKKW